VLVLCIARHDFISQHIARFFARAGTRTPSAVGLDEGATRAMECHPDVVVCEYDLLATLPLGVWEHEDELSRLPILAVSLTRRPGEAHLLDVNGISGFFYLPALTEDAAQQVLEGATRGIVRAPAESPLTWVGGGHTPAQQPV
jgi:hypothetical protein